MQHHERPAPNPQVPIITWPLNEDSIPKWLIEQIIRDRQASENIPNPTATDSEALAYLMGASLSMPLQTSWANVFFYCFTKTMDSVKKKVPADLRKNHIDRTEQALLEQLKDWLYKKQREHKAKNIRNPAP